MFTNKIEIEKLIGATGLTYIDKGVMTDKYEYSVEGVSYIVRCYPKGREFLAEAEFCYMRMFNEMGILCPRPITYSHSGCTAYLIYEKLNGFTLSEVFETLTPSEKTNTCQQIIENYSKIARIPCSGYGEMVGFNKFSHDSWETFVSGVKQKAGSLQSSIYERLIKKWDLLSDITNKDKSSLIWSDFSLDNIIVNDRGDLVGFIDFEGLMAGLYELGFGYMQAHENNSDFARRILRVSSLNSSRLDYFAIMRYLRLLPYCHMDLPNGEKRNRIDLFLPYINSIK